MVVLEFVQDRLLRAGEDIHVHRLVGKRGHFVAGKVRNRTNARAPKTERVFALVLSLERERARLLARLRMEDVLPEHHLHVDVQTPAIDNLSYYFSEQIEVIR